jgi:hypothetical protein
MLGRNPNLRIAIFSSKVEQAQKIANSIKKYIETSTALHAIFPHLKPSKPWSGMNFCVKRTTNAKDPSVSVYSVGSDRVHGSRLDVAILDDVLTYENTGTEGNRKHTIEWYYATVPGRMVEGGQVIFIGNAFHPEDLMHELAKNSTWHWERFPVCDPDTGESHWPEYWSQAAIAAKRREYPAHEFARQMMCIARDEVENYFNRDAIKRCLDRGEGKQPCFSLSYVPQGYSIFTGVDLATGRKRNKGDKTAMFTFALHPNGDREVLNLESGRWQGPEIVQRIIDTHNRYHSIIAVENNAAQEYILQFTKQISAVPIVPHHTGANKVDPVFGVQSIAVEMANGKWIIPSIGGECVPEIAAWIQDMLYYDPTKHTGDRLMASWFARELSRKTRPRAQISKVNMRAR